MNQTPDVTEILLQAGRGDAAAVDLLFRALYDDLRVIAVNRIRHERSGHTLQATALVHEAYMRLIDQTRCQWRNRAHFLAVASQVMRRILVDHARSRNRQKRGGAWKRVTMEEALEIGGAEGEETLLLLDSALRKFEEQEPVKARVVVMRFFGGLTNEECAELLEVSARTAARYWDYAQAWLYREMTAGPAPG